MYAFLNALDFVGTERQKLHAVVGRDIWLNTGRSQALQLLLSCHDISACLRACRSCSSLEPVLRLTFRLFGLRENQPLWKSGLLTHRRPQPPRQLPHFNFPRIHDQAVKVVAASATSKIFVKMTLDVTNQMLVFGQVCHHQFLLHGNPASLCKSKFLSFL